MQSGRGPGRRNQEEGRTRRGSNSDAANTAAKVAGPLAAGLRKQYHYSAAEALNPLQPMINGLSLIQKCLPLAISLYLFSFSLDVALRLSLCLPGCTGRVFAALSAHA